MKLRLGLTLFLCIGFIGTVSASKFTIPESFEFLAVDGKDLGSGWVSSLTSIDLSAGEHKIAVEYSVKIEDDAQPQMDRFLSSEPLLITFIVEEGKGYRLVPHSSIKTDPDSFAESPRLKIMGGRNVIEAEISLLVQNQQSRWAKVTQNYNAPTQPRVSDMARVTGSSKPMIDNIGGTPSASMLVYWWNQADQQTRDNFIKQINK